MSRQANYEQPISVLFNHPDGRKLTASALLVRDVGHLHPNRMEIIGTRNQEFSTMGFMNEGVITWQLYHNKNWNSDYDGISEEEYGQGYFTKSGTTNGRNIAPNSIQKHSEFIITSYTNKYFNLDRPISNYTSFLFLPRLSRWSTYRKNQSLKFNLHSHGEWHNISNSPLRFRSILEGFLHDDDRDHNETLFIQIPGLEYSYKNSEASKNRCLFSDANEAWSDMVPLLMFYHKRIITLLKKDHRINNSYLEEWHPKPLDNKSLSLTFENPPFMGKPQSFLAAGASTMSTMRAFRPHIHAAAHAYVDCIRASTPESALTSCIEGIERVVTTFELSNDISRDLISKSKWKNFSSKIKLICDEEFNGEKNLDQIKGSICVTPKYRLHDRIIRMASHFSKHWTESELSILRDISLAISFRNDIVHGRVISDLQKLDIELNRSIIIFEKLFCCLVGFYKSKSLDLPWWATREQASD